jgi:hypothetical protein
MTRRIAAALLLVGCALSAAGCAAPGPAQAGPGSPSYAPYDDVSNPFCGALGNCEPLRSQPYDMHGNTSGGT